MGSERLLWLTGRRGDSHSWCRIGCCWQNSSSVFCIIKVGRALARSLAQTRQTMEREEPNLEQIDSNLLCQRKLERIDLWFWINIVSQFILTSIKPRGASCALELAPALMRSRSPKTQITNLSPRSWIRSHWHR